ncbi:Leucine-rich repeat [Macleaya cordata]|uniref:Leucine-rich repeat n=1 Tax=Macleaya cordata TaxID=56857 RepID=A0A200QRV9_MACCD|nr:Leucine-rich repeat [Macleaya cordata]
MRKTFQDNSQDQALKFSGVGNSLRPLVLDTSDDNPSNNSAEKVTSSSSNECYWKSEEMHSGSSPEDSTEVNQRVLLHKSRSLGSGLDRESRVSCGIDIETETGGGSSCDDLHEKNYERSFDGSNHSGLEEPSDCQDPGVDLLNEYDETLVAESFQEIDNPGHGEATFTIGDSEQLEEGHADFDTQLYVDRADDSGRQLSGEHADDSGHHMPMIGKSCSLPNMEGLLPKSRDVSPSQTYVGPQGRSCQNLEGINSKGKEYLSHEDGYQAMTDQESDDKMLGSDKDKCENSFSDAYDSYNFGGVAKDWTTPEVDKVDMVKDLQRESSLSLDELPSKDFKIKRIEEWVSTIDLEDRNPLQETGESSHLTDKVKKVSNVLGNAATVKLDAKSPIEVAKNYISSLSPMSTSAQMVNLGLVVIPFLSAFVSLRVLNLSGNAIVRITAGALPRGLHALNLSKNNISTIEGLRELTRLRVLDLSYNRISRIGHGLASCSSLKELYLAGNKISEVEGLHRLLKLNILDLRFNKISTSKCLGQLAANYSSLQTISLEGNPAQRNVGDEQLKKYLQSLLPHLVYFNKQSIRASSSKEVADRPTRSALTTRPEHNKLTRKGIIPTAATSKVSSSTIHGRMSQAVSSLKQSKGRHGRLPLGGSKGTHHRHHYPDLDDRLLNLQMNLSMRRSQSEGNLGAS